MRKKVLEKSTEVKARVWKYPGLGGWHFISLGKKESNILKSAKEGKRIAWGYIPVTATVGTTSWDTTFFPTKEGQYLLAVKAIVRKKEKIFEGDMVKVRYSLR